MVAQFLRAAEQAHHEYVVATEHGGDEPGIGNLRASISGEDWIGRGTVEVAAWVHNVFDEEYQIEGQGSFYLLHANRLAVFGDPRLFGVDLRYEF